VAQGPARGAARYPDARRFTTPTRASASAAVVGKPGCWNLRNTPAAPGVFVPDLPPATAAPAGDQRCLAYLAPDARTTSLATRSLE
jgi:hypothetical protein